MARDGRRSGLFVTLLFLGIATNPQIATAAGTFPVFGPETFVRPPGRPVGEVRTFTVASPFATTWTLRLEDGDGGGFGPANSAFVKLNDAFVIRPADFSRNASVIVRPVTLAANNVLSVDLRGTPGTGFTLKIEGADAQPPLITVVAAPAPNAAGWNHSNVTVTFTCSDALSGVASCPSPVTVATEGAAQAISGTAVDRAGNSATASVPVSLDKTAPALTVTSPTDGGTVTDPRIQVQGSVDETLSGLAALACNGTPATVSAGVFSCDLTLAEGDNAISVTALDVAGNSTSADLTATFAPPLVPLEVHIGEPRDGLITRDSQVTVSGTLSRPGVTVLLNGTPATVTDTAFSATVDLVEGTNRLAATAEGQGDAATDAITVRRDTVPPLIVIETPRDGERLVDETVTVAGTVNDIIPGATVNADDVSLTVGGTPTPVNNRTFSLAGVPLEPGLNTLEAVAVDRAGNVRRSAIQVTREPDLAGIRVRIVSGNDQRAPILHDLAEPLVVRLEGPDGSPLPDRPVEFTVSKGDGVLGDPARKLRRFTLLTDGKGLAMVLFRVGSRTGEGFHRVRATTPGSLTFADFCATALPGEATRIAISRMPPVRGAVGQPVPDVLSVIVSDDHGNAIANVPVTFQVEFGGGGLGPTGTSPTFQAQTNQDGIADAVLTLGSEPGRANNQVSADFAGNPGLPIYFNLSGVAVGPAALTTVSGVVQNVAGQPIVGALAEVEGTGLTATTGPDGTFRIENVPPGGQRVKIHGSAASDAAANVFYPDIDFAIEAISGADNPLNQIVALPFLDMANAKMVGGDEDVTLEMAGVPGFAIKVFAHSTIRHDGTRGPVLMSSSQVKFDKMPMPPPQGATPFVVGTLQPGGIHFDPPAQVIYPNVGGLAPGDVADVFAFHHDIGQYVNVGPGTVSEDGTVIATDPGFGFVQSGWHGVIRFPGPTAQAANGCSARLEWQWVRQNGSLGPVSNGLVILDQTNMDARRAVLRVRFAPGGGSFDSIAWSGGAPLLTRSGESASGSTSTVTVAVTGTDGGRTLLTSPVYRIRGTNGQDDQTCQAEVEVAAVHLELRQDGELIDRDAIASITTEPRMPNLTARLLGGTADLQVRWRLLVAYRQGNRNDECFFPGPQQAATRDLNGSQTWNLQPDFGTRFCGGMATLYYSISGSPEQTFPFRLWGRNPTQATVRGQLALVRHHLIAWREGRFQQFQTLANFIRRWEEGPLSVLHAGDNGFGIMQLTSGMIPTEQLWSWQQNADEGERRADGFTTSAGIYNDQVQQGLAWDHDTGGRPPREGQAFPSAPEFTSAQLDRETWARYNSGFRYHDYDPDQGAWVNRNTNAPGNLYADDLNTRRDNLPLGIFPPLWN